MAKNSNTVEFDTDTQARGRSRTGSASERLSGVTQSASQQIDSSPLIALGAGVALGAVLGAAIPVSRKEKEVLGPVGSKIADAGYGAMDRAKDMGKQKFDEMAGDKVREFLGVGSGTSGGSNA